MQEFKVTFEPRERGMTAVYNPSPHTRRWLQHYIFVPKRCWIPKEGVQYRVVPTRRIGKKIYDRLGVFICRPVNALADEQEHRRRIEEKERARQAEADREREAREASQTFIDKLPLIQEEFKLADPQKLGLLKGLLDDYKRRYDQRSADPGYIHHENIGGSNWEFSHRVLRWTDKTTERCTWDGKIGVYRIASYSQSLGWEMCGTSPDEMRPEYFERWVSSEVYRELIEGDDVITLNRQAREEFGKEKGAWFRDIEELSTNIDQALDDLIATALAKLGLSELYKRTFSLKYEMKECLKEMAHQSA
ncbi:MAG: hypothetical protein V1668_02650 [Patescibacteria group bacterium]